MKRAHVSNIFYPLILFLIFTTMAIISVLFAARIYFNIIEHADTNFAIGTPVHYVTEKIRKNDTVDNIAIRHVDHQDILVLKDPEYNAVTYIYTYNGKLMELYADNDTPFSFKAGSEVMELQSFTASIKNNLLSMTFKDSEGNVTEDCRAIRSERSSQ